MDITLYIALLIAFLYGVKTVVHRFVIKNVSTAFIMLISAIVYGVSVLFYSVMFKSKDIKMDWKKHKKYVWILGLTTFLGLFVANILYFYVIKHTVNINYASIFMALYPVVTVIFAALILNESLNSMQMIGFSMILIGIMIMIYFSKVIVI